MLKKYTVIRHTQVLKYYKFISNINRKLLINIPLNLIHGLSNQLKATRNDLLLTRQDCAEIFFVHRFMQSSAWLHGHFWNKLHLLVSVFSGCGTEHAFTFISKDTLKIGVCC